MDGLWPLPIEPSSGRDRQSIDLGYNCFVCSRREIGETPSPTGAGAAVAALKVLERSQTKAALFSNHRHRPDRESGLLARPSSAGSTKPEALACTARDLLPIRLLFSKEAHDSPKPATQTEEPVEWIRLQQLFSISETSCQHTSWNGSHNRLPCFLQFKPQPACERKFGTSTMLQETQSFRLFLSDCRSSPAGSRDPVKVLEPLVLAAVGHRVRQGFSKVCVLRLSVRQDCFGATLFWSQKTAPQQHLHNTQLWQLATGSHTRHETIAN